MKPSLIHCSAALTASLFLLPVTGSAAPAATPAAIQMARTGQVPVKAAGPYVEIGSYRIRVFAKLGRPDAKLADGSWLYENFKVKGGNARGILLVSFREGRVSDLALVSPEIAFALRESPAQPPSGILIAAQERR